MSPIALDEDLWFGLKDDSEAERLAAESMAALAGRVHGSRPLPESARQLLDLTSGNAYSPDQAVVIIEKDASMAARVLRLVNSVGFGLKVRCKTVRHAVSLLGASQLHNLATAAGILELFPEQAEGSALILEHATVVAAFARHLASEWDLSADEMFTCGFLMDLGQLIMLHEEQPGYPELLGRAAITGESVHELERQAYGFDHAVLAAHVLVAWKIPNPVPKVVAWHHQPARALRAGEQFGARVALLRLCDELATELEKGRDRVNLGRIAESEAASWLGVDYDRLGRLYGELSALRLAALGRPKPLDPPQPRPMATPSGPRSLPPVVLSCVVCRAASLGEHCPRCGGNVCQNHTLGHHACCPRCEAEWEMLLAAHGPSGVERTLLWASALLLALLMGVVLTTSPHQGVVALGARRLVLVCVATMLGLFALRAHRKWSLRDAFLHQQG